MFCDVFKRSWGGVFFKDGKKMEFRDYWLDVSDDIIFFEVKVLLYFLFVFRDYIREFRVDVYIDNRIFKVFIENFGCKSFFVNEFVKEIL